MQTRGSSGRARGRRNRSPAPAPGSQNTMPCTLKKLLVNLSDVSGLFMSFLCVYGKIVILASARLTRQPPLCDDVVSSYIAINHALLHFYIVCIPENP